ncbi:MAG TPA: ABC transporter substrate-binding protein [Candidatus Limnocylindrales bacterium]|nr:ABC transporter substrate-binding protein [Candidatus Limnocylindrales bacterium]
MKIRHAAPAIALLLLGSLLVAGCGDAATSAPASPGPAGRGSAAPSASAAAPPGDAAATPSGAARRVRLALDWTPNTNHTGFYVAQAKGWYADAGVGLEVLPYGGTTPETIIAAGQAECGISFQDSMTFAVAAGAPITSVMAILQHTAQEIAVLEASSITRPKDLDGKVYAGFGYPNEVPTLKSVITNDGGTGEFDVVTLDTAAYEALYNERADFVITFSAWEAIEAELRGIDLRVFEFTDYGFPDFYQVVLACNRDWLAANPDTAEAFVAATVRGFELAAENPAEASQILIDENPGVFDANPELPTASQRFMAESGLLVDEEGFVGMQTLEQWTAYSAFLYEQGLLVDADGKALTAPPDYASLFTNDFLPMPPPG